MKVKKENIVLILIVVLFAMIYILSELNPNVLFAANIIICIFICIKAKFSLFSIKSFLINYVLIAVAFQYNTGKSYGLLSMGIYPLRYDMMCGLALIYNCIMLVYLINSNILKREEEILKYKVQENIIFSTICSVLAIGFSIIAFPSLNFKFGSSARFNALLPGNAWNHMAIISLIFAMPNFKKSKIVKFSYLFCIAWFLLHSERVDMVGLILALIIILIVNGKETAKKLLSFKNMKYYIIGLIAFVVLVYIGEYRSGRTEINFETITRKMLVQNTAADVGYVYNSAILYKEANGLMYGKTYLLYIIKIIPLISSAKYDAVAILQKTYNTAGGILNLAEPYMNFGVLGIVLFAIAELSIINFILKKKKDYNFFLYIFILATPFRVTWYGLMYIEKGIIYIMPVLYILYMIINRNNNIKELE